ncbi:DUF1214 domain-containing protein [Streptomyces sp. ISL-36]|nr:DUF1214 domain-containing protein [Streptomyces sp. ISL-36]
MADADGDTLSGEQDYILHFDTNQLRPVDAFWSVTMYDAEGSRSPTSSTGSHSGTATRWCSTPTAPSTS